MKITLTDNEDVVLDEAEVSREEWESYDALDMGRFIFGNLHPGKEAQ